MSCVVIWRLCDNLFSFTSFLTSGECVKGSTTTSELNSCFAEIEKLQAQIAELKSAKQELSSDVVVEPLTHSPEVKNEVKLNKLSPNRQMTTQDIVMAKLFN